MRKYHWFSVSIVILLLGILAMALTGLSQAKRPPQASTDLTKRSALTAREDAYRANNLGVALLEQFKYKEGAEAFQRALRIDPKLAIARLNLGIALYNVPDIESALRESKMAAELLPDAPQPHYILGLIAKSQNRTTDALAAFQRVLKLDSRDVGANVNLGQLYAQERKYPEAIAAFRAALAVEPYNTTAAYGLAQALLRSGQREEGQQVLQKFQQLRQSGVGTSIGQNYLEQGRYAEAVISTGAEPELVDRSTPNVTFTDATAGIISRPVDQKARAVSAPANAKSSAKSPRVDFVFGRRFKPAEFTAEAKRELIASLSGGATLFDYDGDGDLDLFEVAPSGQRLYRDDSGKFVDVTARSGALNVAGDNIGIGAVAGDYDNDGRPDLFILRDGTSALYHNDGDGRFSDVTAAVKIPAYPYLSISCAFVDIDHDGDLDIFIAGLADLTKETTYSALGKASGLISFPKDFAGAPNLLLRNNGNGTFTDITAAAKLTGSLGHAVAVVPTDYDNRRDIDLLVANFGSPPVLYRNLRDGTFRDVAHEAGLDVDKRRMKDEDWNYTYVAAGDVNKDGYTDFFFGDGVLSGVFATSDGHERFIIEDKTPWLFQVGSPASYAAQFIDYDNDGLLDLVRIGSDGVHVWRNLGNEWRKISSPAESGTSISARPLLSVGLSRTLASGDIDGDGDIDLVLRSPSGNLLVGRNEGGNRNHSVRVQLAGKVSNRSGVGSKIEARAGSLWQKLETYAATPAPAPTDVIFGLGKREAPDAVRVLWPAGIVQAETEIAQTETGYPKEAKGLPTPAPILTITEIDRKPSSCPYLYTWNGERFEFITDFMGGGEMGDWLAPGVYNQPDPDEYVRIRGDQLKARHGRYEIRITNELEEALFVDRLQLIVVAHRMGVEIYPNEGLRESPPPFKLYTTHDAHPPVAAMDDHGHDVLSRITKLDRQYPDDFRLERIRGYAEKHTLTLNLGAMGDKRTLLLLTGWTDYAFSSDNVAASQRGMTMMPPALQVKDARGQWQTIIPDVGIPVGRPQTIVVDLTRKFLSRSREVRIVTNMRIYWDQILVDTSDGDFPVQMIRLEPLTADLRWRGFSAETSPDEREPFGYDYARVSFASPWKAFPGRYTREGDVCELLRQVDDMFVVSRSGDEIALSFDVTLLPPLPKNWTRTFLLYADGFSKEMDINSASPEQLAPLPFHGMKSYPYKSPETYPMDQTHRDYIERYNTRVVAAPVPQLVNSKW